MESIIDLLHKGGYSCVMKNGEEVRTFTQRGVADLYDLYQADPSFMKGASIADKVIGKGAAALMVLGGLKAVYADIISTPALALLREAGIEVTFAREVPYIINRAGTGRCPLETACGDLKSVEEMYPVICNFITGMRVVKRIKSLITQGETSEVEFKSARGGFPGSFWESYSAFANTNGGTIVLGVVERNNQFFLDELTEESIVRYKKNFWDCAHNKGKINACLPRESDIRIEKVEESYILICDIPRASYELRPIYISPNPFGNTYRRNHEGDYLCTDAEVRRMFADAEHDRHPQDGRILVGYDFERDIDMESLHQYRQTFASLQPSHPWVGISDMDFLKKIGAYATEYETGKEGFTLAGILMFGKYDSITNNSGDPMFFVDYRECIAADNPDTRWTHRIYPDGMWEANLYQFYIRVYNRLIQSLPRPFMIKNGIRQEETPAHDAVREALINALIHQDVNAMGNIIVERTDDNLIFRNPGMMLVSKQQYFEGGRSICRNPILQKMFMRLGRAEKAGSGVDKIVSGWLSLGWPLPTVAEETRPDYVVLTMQLGIEARQENPTRKPDKKARQENPTRKPDKKTRQENPTRKPRKQDLRKEQILKFCVEPKSLYDILQHLGLKDRENLMEVYINPMIGLGILEMTEPDNPTSRNQMYITVKVEM